MKHGSTMLAHIQYGTSLIGMAVMLIRPDPKTTADLITMIFFAALFLDASRRIRPSEK